MIRKLTRDDHDLLFQYLKDDASLNLFMLGDIEVFGWDVDFQDVWAEFDEKGELRSTLFRFYQAYMPYAKGDFDAEAYAEIISQDEKFEVLQGRSDLVEQIERLGKLPIVDTKDTYFAELKNGNRLDKSLDISRVKVATLADVDRIMDVRSMAFGPNKSQREQLIKVMESGMARTFYTEDEETGVMTSIASTTAENSISAMIVGVVTPEEYRNRGLASLCMTALCEQLLSEGRTLCLFYHNPAAGSIYKRLGFEDIGMWRMCKSPILFEGKS